MSPAALPLVVVAVAFGYLFFKFRGMQTDRSDTKSIREKDSKDLHEQCQKNSWDIHRLKEEFSHRDTLLEDLRQQVNELNVNLAVVSQKLDSLVDALKEIRK